MFVRTSRVTRGGKTYEYHQLVRSYRRDDGQPAHKVICSLKDWSRLEIENLKKSLKASRNNQPVCLAPKLANALNGAKIVDNLQYLDVAVLHQLWQQWGLDDLLGDLVDDKAKEVRFSHCVESLVLQRCVAAGSKLSATRWFPRSSLPELLGIDIGQFNNTRIHRVLGQLEQVETELKTRLPKRLHHREGHFAALFLDVTDTWFEGRGPQIASRGKTKEGMTKKKVGIVLMCNEKGYPVAWETVAGNIGDESAMLSVLNDVQGAKWLRDVPLVVDRAMGTTKTLGQLNERGIRFVCALRKLEFASYTTRIPCHLFSNIDIDDVHALRRVSEIADKSEMERIDDGTYLLDLGIISKAHQKSVIETPLKVEGNSQMLNYLAQSDQINEGLAEGRWTSLREAGEHFGYTKQWAYQRALLHRITSDIRQDLEVAGAPQLSFNELVKISRQPAQQQRKLYFSLKKQAAKRPPPAHSQRRTDPGPTTTDNEGASLALRGIIAFSPELFVEQRRKAHETLGQLYSLVAKLNIEARQKAASASKMKREIEKKLQAKSLINAFKIHTFKGPDQRPQLELQLRADKWQARRRYDGFSLLVAHPELAVSPFEIHRLYRSKNIVETDFRTMKSVVELRPVYHRNEAKIRAHVTICVLALLLERTLSDQLRAISMTGETAIDRLSSCRLNRIELTDEPEISTYTVTMPTAEQLAILRQLELTELVDEPCVVEAIYGR
jgi:transposase